MSLQNIELELLRSIASGRIGGALPFGGRSKPSRPSPISVPSISIPSLPPVLPTLNGIQQQVTDFARDRFPEETALAGKVVRYASSIGQDSLSVARKILRWQYKTLGIFTRLTEPPKSGNWTPWLPQVPDAARDVRPSTPVRQVLRLFKHPCAMMLPGYRALTTPYFRDLDDLLWVADTRERDVLKKALAIFGRNE